MSYTTERISSNKMKLVFTIPAAEFAEAVQKAYLRNRSKIRVDGFRKGKAPRFVIERLYGKDIFYEDAVNEWLPDQYDHAIEEADIREVDQPQVDVDWAAVEPDKDVTVTCEVYVYPEVTLGEYKGLTVEVEPVRVDDAMVDARIEQERQKLSRSVEILDRPAAEGDTVNLDYTGTVDGVAFEGGTAEGQTLTLGSHQFIPGFEEQMVGMCVAEERDLNVTFPENYHAAELAGKNAVFHVKVNSISATELPELDDDFAADVSDFTTFAEYRQSIVDELTKQAEDKRRADIENAAVLAAADAAQVEIPDAMVNRELNDMLQDMNMRMTQQGYSLKQFMEWTGQTADSLIAQYRPGALSRVRQQLVMEAVRKAENPEISEEELEEEISRQAERMGKPLDEFKASLTDAQRESLKELAQTLKVIKLMAETAVVKEKAEEPEAPAEDAEQTPEA